MIRNRPLLRSLSALSVNMAAAWFGLAFITPTFISVTALITILALTRDIGFGMLFLLISVQLEGLLEDE